MLSFKFFASFYLLLSTAQGLYLEKINVDSLNNTRIAYYPGSFDPPHLGHMAVVKSVLSEDLADYVLIYAMPDSDASKNRTPYLMRFSMLESIYGEHPKVLITKLMPAEMQEKLSPLFNRIEFSVVLGSDIVKTYVKTSQYDPIWMQGLPIKQTKPEDTHTSTGAIMAIPAHHVIAFNRNGDDLSYLGGIYKKRPLTLLPTQANADLSSTKVRLAAKQGASLVEMVPMEIKKIIEENGLYRE